MKIYKYYSNRKLQNSSQLLYALETISHFIHAFKQCITRIKEQKAIVVENVCRQSKLILVNLDCFFLPNLKDLNVDDLNSHSMSGCL